MQIELRRVNDQVHFQGFNEALVSVHVDGPESIGGVGQGVRPMELVLFALASCSAMDLVEIIRKQRMRLDDLRIVVDGTRATDRTPAVFTAIHLHYYFAGELRRDAVERAVDLALHKYCSVEAMLAPTVKITQSITIEGEATDGEG